MERGARDSGVTLAELLAAFSLATDLELGQPMEHVLRAWRIACRLAERVGLAEDERRSLFFIAMLAWVGCVADTPEVAAWFGDDIAFRGDSYQVELAGLPGLGFLVRHAGAGGSALHRLRLASTLTVTGGRGVLRGIQSHRTTASTMAGQLGLGREVCSPLRQFFTRWDGRGVPGGVGGEEIAAPVRLFHVADVEAVGQRFVDAQPPLGYVPPRDPQITRPGRTYALRNRIGLRAGRVPESALTSIFSVSPRGQSLTQCDRRPGEIAFRRAGRYLRTTAELAGTEAILAGAPAYASRIVSSAS